MATNGTMLMCGFESAFVGGLRRAGQTYPIAVYDYNTCIDILMSRDEMSEEEAIEFIETQSLNAWFGEGTPCMLFSCSLDEFKDLSGDDLIEVSSHIMTEAEKLIPHTDPDEEEEEDDEKPDRDPGDEDPNAYSDENDISEDQNKALGKALMDYAINFMNYVKEVSPEMFLRAKEYAIDYSGNEHIKFTDVWKDEDEDKQ